MATTYYIDGTTLSTATAVYTDAALTTCAPDGFYSDGYVAREQVGCVLQTAQTCPECATGCGSSISATGGQGIYLLTLDTGTDTGAIVIGFNPRGIPDGIRATYDSVSYNELSAVNDGYHASTTSGNFTFVGDTAFDCGISGTTYPSLVEKEYNGSSFVATGNTQSVTVAAGDVSLGGTPGFCYMVIPKPNAAPSTVLIEMVGPCSTTAFDITASCPVLLTGFSSSTTGPDKETVCGYIAGETYYNAPVNGTAGVPGLYDWVFSDQYGQTVLSDGWYALSGNPNGDTMRVADGVVNLFNNCPSIFISTVVSTCSDFCGATNYTIPTAVATYPSQTYATLSIGTVIEGSNVDGFYAYSGVSTDTATGPFRIMELVSNQIVGLYECSGGSCVAL
jgi:hypothetical protein